MVSLGYKEYKTGRTYMTLMGHWTKNKDEEIELDGVGGVSILVKADVHRSGTIMTAAQTQRPKANVHPRNQLPLLSFREPSRDRRLRQDGQAGGLRSIWTAQLRRLAYRHRREGRERIDSRTRRFMLSLHSPDCTVGLRGGTCAARSAPCRTRAYDTHTTTLVYL